MKRKMKRTKKATPKKHTRPRAPKHTRKTSSAKHTRKTSSAKHTRKTSSAAAHLTRTLRRIKRETERTQAACPHNETLVIEVRRPKITRRGNVGQVRRRLQCVQCKHRFTQYGIDDKGHRRARRGRTFEF